MLIDCDRCEMRDIACADCVVGVLITAADAQSAERGMPPGAPSARPAAPATGRARQARGADLAGPARPGAAAPAEAAATGAAHQPGAPGAEIGEPERQALHTLAAAGLVPPLRLVLPGPDRGAPAGEFPDAEAS